MGWIAIEGLQFYSHHGYYQEEQKLGGKYSVDIYMQLNYGDAASTDDLKKTVNYEEVYQIAKTEMEIHAQLIEHVCHRIFEHIKRKYPQLEDLKVRVSKHHPPLKGQVDRVYVELGM